MSPIDSGFVSRFYTWFLRFVNPPGFSLAQRILSSACLLTFLLSILVLLVNLSLKMPVLLMGLNALMALLYMLLYIQSRRRHSDYIALLYVYLSLLILIGIWFPNGGITGSTSLFCTGLLTLGCSILPRKHVFTFIFLLISSISVLYILELRFPLWALAYSSVQQQKLDLFFSLMIALVIIGICLFVFRQVQASEKRMVQNAMEYKSRFLSHMSHELRTPLNAVLGFSQVLQKNKQGTLSKKDLDYLQRIFNSGQHMLGLVNDLLDLARLESQELPLHQESIDLEALILQVFKSFEIQAQTQQQEFVYQPPETPIPVIYTDPSRLRQILINLIGNSIKYTPKHEQIILKMRRGSNMIWIDVIDTGPGIASEHQNLIFKPFFQLDTTSQGAGLGLAITAQLCQSLGYSLTLKSQPGEGCSFTIGIPL